MVLLIPSKPLISALYEYNNLTLTLPPDSVSIQRDPPPSYLDHKTIKTISSTLIIAHAADPENAANYRLNRLLRGCAVYVPPKPPKPEPTEEYKALMAQLRAQTEAESYRSMLSQADYNLSYLKEEEEEEYTLKQLNSDLSLIVNILFSILAAGGAVWAAASSWAIPERFALAFVAAIVVGVAEVVVLGSYYRKIAEAKALEKNKVERKQVLRALEVGAGKKVD